MMEKNKNFVHKLKHFSERVSTLSKMVALALVMGAALGAVGAVFYHAITIVTDARLKYPWLLLLLPFGAVIILYFYHVLHGDRDKGTNLVLSSIQSGKDVPLRMSLLIFVSTVFSHLCGASVGREGAALQMGGTIGFSIGKALKLDDRETSPMMEQDTGTWSVRLPADLYEAATMDGANKWQQFTHVTLPQLQPTTFFASTMLIISCFKIYDVVAIMTEGGPGRSTKMLVTYIYDEAFSNFNYGIASAIAMVLLVIVLIFTLAQFSMESRYANN